jgi:hypothetical protein
MIRGLLGNIRGPKMGEGGGFGTSEFDLTANSIVKYVVAGCD